MTRSASGRASRWSSWCSPRSAPWSTWTCAPTASSTQSFRLTSPPRRPNQGFTERSPWAQPCALCGALWKGIRSTPRDRERPLLSRAKQRGFRTSERARSVLEDRPDLIRCCSKRHLRAFSLLCIEHRQIRSQPKSQLARSKFPAASCRSCHRHLQAPILISSYQLSEV